MVHGDAVLLEWAIEVLVKNAIDALAGRGGRMDMSATRAARRRARVRVADDGPGVPRELRARIFEPGFRTKESGWGIGLSLARRIVEENHGGELLLTPSERGATFDIILPLMAHLLSRRCRAARRAQSRAARSSAPTKARCSCSPAPGSGKTRVLTTRIARLIEHHGVDPAASSR